jgi:hypothetical protein
MLVNKKITKAKRSTSFDPSDDWNGKKRQRLTWVDKNNQPEPSVHLDPDPMQIQSQIFPICTSYPNDEVMVTNGEETVGFLDHNYWKISPCEYIQSLENAML